MFLPVFSCVCVCVFCSSVSVCVWVRKICRRRAPIWQGECFCKLSVLSRLPQSVSGIDMWSGGRTTFFVEKGRVSWPHHHKDLVSRLQSLESLKPMSHSSCSHRAGKMRVCPCSNVDNVAVALLVSCCLVTLFSLRLVEPSKRQKTEKRKEKQPPSLSAYSHLYCQVAGTCRVGKPPGKGGNRWEKKHSFVRQEVGIPLDEKLPKRCDDLVLLAEQVATVGMAPRTPERAAAVNRLYIDISQCGARRPWSRHDIRSITTSSEIWMHSHARTMIMPELFKALGFESANLTGLSKLEAKSLIGECMSPACVTMVVMSLVIAMDSVWRE